MNFNTKLLSLVIIIFLLSIACSDVATSPPEPQNPPAVSSPAPAPTPVGGGPTQPDGLETVTVAKIIDGDTIALTDGRRVRYIGINTPERNQPYYQEASDMNRQLVGGKQVQLEFDVETFDKYGRTLAYIWVNGVMANIEIVDKGFANAFTVPPNVHYETEFRRAEQLARETERGLWAGSTSPLKITHIEANAPGSDLENPNGEWVEVANRGTQPVQMRGYTLKDEANHIYTFDNFSIPAGEKVRLHSGQGNDTDVQLYWGLVNESVWNNDSDAAFLRDSQGALVDTLAY